MKLTSARELFVRAMTILAALSVSHSVTYGQEPQPSAAATKTAPAQPPPAAQPDFWNQETMTGDWNGTRPQWKDKGIELEFMLTQFAQGVAAGGIHEGSVYNGKFQTVFKFTPSAGVVRTIARLF
jgi:carbohydrate-selective porin OprB